MTKLHCPICERPFEGDAPDAALPFCSPRCKQVDAGRWLDERYGLPVEREEPEADVSDSPI